MPRTLKYGEKQKSGKPIAENWQPCWSYTFLSHANRFPVPQNMGIDIKIRLLTSLDQKL